MTAVISRGLQKEKPLGNKVSLSSFLPASTSPEMTVRSLRAGPQPADEVKTLPHQSKNTDRLKMLKGNKTPRLGRHTHRASCIISSNEGDKDHKRCYG